MQQKKFQRTVPDCTVRANLHRSFYELIILTLFPNLAYSRAIAISVTYNLLAEHHKVT